MEPRPRPGRNWLAVSALTLLVAAATAGVTVVGDGPSVAAAGVVLVAALSVGVVAAVPEELAAAWAEHRRYVHLSVGLFGVGSLLGATLYLAGVDLTELLFELLAEELPEPEDPAAEFEIELSATFFVVQNTPPFLVSILGAFTLGALTVLVMFVNGFLVGNVAFAVGAAVGVDFIVVGLLPHGIFELPALFVAAGVGFRLLHRLGGRLLGSRETALDRAYLRRTGSLILFAWLLLVVAAFVEAYLTPTLLEALFATRLEAG